jgi:nicotinamidase-related amidase
MKPAVIVIDMIKGNEPYFKSDHRKILPKIEKLLEWCRERGIPVIYANDSYLENDWLFNFMEKHAVRGTDELTVVDRISPKKGDIIIEKRRFSAFFRTDLDITLRELGIDTVVLAGINTHVCVLSTAFDAISLDFYTILLKDCCASSWKRLHEFVVNDFRGLPAFRVMDSGEFMSLFANKGKPSL